MTFLQKSRELLDTEFVKLVKQAENSKDAPSLISRTNTLNCKSEEQPPFLLQEGFSLLSAI